MKRNIPWRIAATFLLIVIHRVLCAQDVSLRGQVTDPQGNGLSGATLQLLEKKTIIAQTISGADGRFILPVQSNGEFVIQVDAAGFRTTNHPVSIRPGINPPIEIRMNLISTQIEYITVAAHANALNVLTPDPAEKVFVRQDLLDANPGRPGAPISIPGYPIETASSGIKAPQYFAPGVAGDHGEPIAQFIQVGSYLVPNNLSANAHGNGYSDPNIFIPEALESVQVDGGAFNVREGNHSVNLAATYGFLPNLDPYITFTGDYRDADAVVGISPTATPWVALEGSYGNGFLDRLEHRQQYKFNGQQVFDARQHTLTLLGIGYYGQSYIPGLVPIFALNSDDANFPNLGDTIDPRQKDQTHTALIALNDDWRLNHHQQLQSSGFFRTYNLSLYSNFGQGLIRQSEFRTVTGASTNYMNKITESLSFLGGLDYEREAPRRDNLDRYGFFDPGNPDYYGPFTPVDSNNVTIQPISPYIAIDGAFTHFLHCYLGWRRDEINVDNEDLLHAQNSFQKWAGVNSPKATVSLLPKDEWPLPQVSLSYGQAYYTNDPRIGTGTQPGTPVSTAHSYQLVASKSFHHTDLRMTLGHVTTSETLAKLDPDTGLQEDEGPGRLHFMTLTARHDFQQASLLATFSKADARDISTGAPTPEAPRTIFDILATLQKLPFHVQARGEFEYVGAKPLGTGCLPDLAKQCVGTPVKELRGVLVRPLLNGRMNIGLNILAAGGYTGQTTENFYPSDIQEVVGVRIPGYASVTLTYHFESKITP